MKQSIYLSDFRDAFHRAGRGNQFSYKALELLYDFCEEVDPDYDLDVIALCCDYVEMTPEEVAKYYGLELSNDGNELNNLADDLYDLTCVVGVTDTTIVFANF